MDKLQSIIKHGDVELTLANLKGDVAYIGKARTVKTTGLGRHNLNFSVESSVVSSVYPFNIAIIHSGPRHFLAFNISDVRVDGAREVQLSY